MAREVVAAGLQRAGEPGWMVGHGTTVRVLRTELIPGSQGLGTFNGGLGIRREYLVLGAPQTATLYTAGGGGFGDPGGRPGARQADDLADGLLSRREEP
jgi:N-methylhydantoinase B/oxoprolinase/acetone carboxylase alpha subunit